MCAVAERCMGRVFAAAEIGGLGCLGGEFGGREVAALVAAIAEGLRFRLTTGAPEIGFAFDQIDGIGGFLGDMGGVGHGGLLWGRGQNAPWCAQEQGPAAGLIVGLGGNVGRGQ